MRRLTRWACPILFLILCITVFWFLHLFTVVDDSMQYIDWTSSVEVMPDGTEEPFIWENYSNTTELSGTYRFSGKLPRRHSPGNLLFEITGAELSLSINGEELYHSSVSSQADTYNLSQATIPLAPETSGELVLTCRITDGNNVMFPPLLRFIPDNLEQAESTAIANRTALPAGAAALALLLTAGLFLLSVSLKAPDWSLIPLALATAGIAVSQLIQTEGGYFLPPIVTQLFGNQETGLLIILVLFTYLAMNRKRRFWKYLGIAALWSAAGLLVSYLASLGMHGSLSSYINQFLLPDLQAGYYNGLVYWLTLWLILVSALISAYSVAHSFAAQQIETQGLILKNQLVAESYRSLEEQISANAFLQHEQKHQLTALECLYEKKDYAGLKVLLDKMKEENLGQTAVNFTEHTAINIILQSTAGKARKNHIRFQAHSFVPKDLNIPETDLCSLLMNLLENASDACMRIARSEDRFILLNIKIVHGYLVIRCENSFTGAVKKDNKGQFLTTKKEPLSHGFGIKQMTAIAEKYHGQLNISYTEEGIFIVQTALLIPQK